MKTCCRTEWRDGCAFLFFIETCAREASHQTETGERQKFVLSYSYCGNSSDYSCRSFSDKNLSCLNRVILLIPVYAGYSFSSTDNEL